MSALQRPRMKSPSLVRGILLAIWKINTCVEIGRAPLKDCWSSRVANYFAAGAHGDCPVVLVGNSMGARLVKGTSQPDTIDLGRQITPC